MRSIQMTRPPVESPPKMIIAFNQQYVSAKPRRSDGGGRSGRPATDDQHVGFSEDWYFTRRLQNGFCGPGAPHSATAGK